MAILETRKLSKHFGGLAAISELDLEVQEGEILGVIGPNGAGKTTFFNVITGYLRPTEGKVLLKGEEIAGLSPNRIAQRGLVRTFQQAELFSRLPVIANMMMGRYMGWKTALWQALLNARSARHERAQSHQRSMDALNFVGLGETPLMLAGNLPHGHQRLLGLAMALAAEPKLMLLDEPITGMNQEEAGFTMGLIKRIRESGITVLVVEHNMRAVMGISDRIVVLNYGRKIAEGSPSQIRGNQEVIDAYLGVEESAP